MLLSFEDLEVSSQPLGVCLERGNISLARPIASAVPNQSIANSDAEREQSTSASDNRKWIHYVCKERLSIPQQLLILRSSIASMKIEVDALTATSGRRAAGLRPLQTLVSPHPGASCICGLHGMTQPGLFGDQGAGGWKHIKRGPVKFALVVLASEVPTVWER